MIGPEDDRRRADEDWERHKEAVAMQQEEDRRADEDHERAIAEDMSDWER